VITTAFLEGRKATLEMILAKAGAGIPWKATVRPCFAMPASSGLSGWTHFFGLIWLH
jgi:hypothetical protein